jgi:hypothetical protein
MIGCGPRSAGKLFGHEGQRGGMRPLLRPLSRVLDNMEGVVVTIQDVNKVFQKEQKLHVMSCVSANFKVGDSVLNASRTEQLHSSTTTYEFPEYHRDRLSECMRPYGKTFRLKFDIRGEAHRILHFDVPLVSRVL